MWYTVILETDKKLAHQQNVFNFIITGACKAYEQVWFVGDQFMSRTFNHFLNEFSEDSSNKGYIKSHFDISHYSGSKFLSNNPSIISRILSNIQKGIKEHISFPRLIVMVLDDDFVRQIKCPQFGMSELFGRIVEYLFREIYKLISSHNDHLPARAKKATYPHFLWIQAPMHKNFPNNMARNKFNIALHKNTVLYENAESLFFDDCDRFTSRGIITYWQAVEATVQYCNTILTRGKMPKKQEHSQHNVSKHARHMHQNDQFHWKKRDTESKRLPKLSDFNL